MSLFRELQRRSVIKVAIAYAAVAWGIAQVADLVLNNFGAPDWIIRITLVVLIVGFPISLILSWAYEITPEGIKRDEDAEESAAESAPSTARRSGSRLTLAWTSSIALIALFAAALSLNVAGVRERLFGGIEPGLITSIAVLPLDNLSGDPEQEYFTDGMTEALTAALGQIESLKVISRTSAMRYRDTDKLIPEIASELGVDALLEGSVLRAGDQVRITLQLIHGPTDRHLMAKNFQRDLRDVLALQNDVARTVADEIQVTLTPSVRQRLQPDDRAAGPNPQAYDTYLKGRYNHNRGSGDGFESALRYYEEAVSIDPGFALAHAALAEVCVTGPIVFAGIRTIDYCADAAIKAVEIDPDLAEARAALATIQFFRWEWSEAEAEFKRAIELNPSSAIARQSYGEYLRISMRLDEALVEARRAESLDPFNLMAKIKVAWTLMSQRNYDEAMAQLNDVLEMEPGFFIAYFNIGLVHAINRDVDNLLASARRVAEVHPDGNDAFEVLLLTGMAHAIRNEEAEMLAIIDILEREVGNVFGAQIAALYGLAGQEQKALNRLDQALEMRSLDLPTTSFPTFDPLREHPRFKAIRRAIGLP
jgi:TolB-like protein